jgi:hypothetical protein
MQAALDPMPAVSKGRLIEMSHISAVEFTTTLQNPPVANTTGPGISCVVVAGVFNVNVLKFMLSKGVTLKALLRMAGR